MLRISNHPTHCRSAVIAGNLAQASAYSKRAFYWNCIFLSVALFLFLLIGIFFIFAAREDARRIHCSGLEFQLGNALHNYMDLNNSFPPLYTVDADGKPLHSWRVLILPYLEQNELYKKIRLDEPWDSEYNKQFHDIVLYAYKCPSNRKTTSGKSCCYSVIAGGAFIPATGYTREMIKDGLENTIAIIEVKKPFCWMDPTADITLAELFQGITSDGRVGSFHSGGTNIKMLFHSGGTNVKMLNGRAMFIRNDISGETLKALATPCDGKQVSIDDYCD